MLSLLNRNFSSLSPLFRTALSDRLLLFRREEWRELSVIRDSVIGCSIIFLSGLFGQYLQQFFYLGNLWPPSVTARGFRYPQVSFACIIGHNIREPRVSVLCCCPFLFSRGIPRRHFAERVILLVHDIAFLRILLDREVLPAGLSVRFHSER